MPHSKQKSENYQNLGGMNVKASPYITGPFQFLDITNMDFQTPGALTKRWGTTQYIGYRSSVPIHGIGEFIQIDGSSFILFAGGTGLYKVDGSSYTRIFTDYAVGWSDGAPIFFEGFTATFKADSPWDFSIYNNQLYGANGQNIFRFDGLGVYSFGVPKVTQNVANAINNYGGTGVGGFSGWLCYKFGYINNNGALGPLSDTTIQRKVDSWFGLQIDGITMAHFDLGYMGHGVSSFYIARAVLNYDGFSTPISLSAAIDQAQFFYVASCSLGTVQYIDTESSNLTLAPMNYLGMNEQTYLGTGSTYGWGATLVKQTMVPTYLEIFQNQMFYAGYSAQPNRVRFSDFAIPEMIEESNYFDVVTPDNDRILGMATYNSKLYFFKQNSFHVLSGDSTENFSLAEISNEYGCLSNRAIIIFNDTMLFLDRRGVCQFNGAGIKIISDPVQQYFNEINIASALGKATMVHDKERNQILVGIPWGASATHNNVTLVYDYLMQAWSKYDGYFPNQYLIAQGRLSNQAVMFSDYSGLIHYTGQSFFGDNGGGFTTYIKSRFIHELGQSVEKQFRRLYLNFAEISGSSLGVTVGFLVNYGTSIQIQRTIYTDPFQTRTDFGLSSKSLAFECAAFNASLPLKIHGFTIEYRFQRAT